MSITSTIVLLPEVELTLIAGDNSYGTYTRLRHSKEDAPVYPSIDIVEGQTVVLGPFNETRKYRIVSKAGLIQTEKNFKGVGSVSTDQVVAALSAANLELVNPANNDELLIKDSSDNGTLKAVTIQSLIDLIDVSAGTSTALTNVINQPSHGLSLGDVIRLDNTGNYIKAIATDEVNAESIGLVSNVQDTNVFTITLQGKVTGLSGLTAGSVYFLSDLTAGGLTLSEPYLPDTVRKPILVAESATTALVQNYIGYNND
jgi:hypothetical protein